MSTQNSGYDHAADLRKRAEELAAEKAVGMPDNPASLPPEETQRLLHKLQRRAGMIWQDIGRIRAEEPLVHNITNYVVMNTTANSAKMLMKEIHPDIIRGNASEIRSLFRSGIGAKGVDSRHAPDEVLDEARVLSRAAECVVAVSGPTDLIVAGDAVARIDNGHAMMSKVTGMGCTASAITGAFAAVNPLPFQAAVHAMAVMGIAGEMAAERSLGPGSFQLNFLDTLYGLQEADIAKRLKMQGLE